MAKFHRIVYDSLGVCLLTARSCSNNSNNSSSVLLRHCHWMLTGRYTRTVSFALTWSLSTRCLLYHLLVDWQADRVSSSQV